MLYDGITLAEGTTVSNFKLVSGTEFPINPSEGQLFYRNDGTEEGVWVYDDATWTKVAGAAAGGEGGSLGGAETWTTATSITLTAASAKVQVVDMTTTNKSVFLPNATLLQIGGPIYLMSATGSPYTVRDANGGLIGTVISGSVASLSLISTASAAGIWVLSQSASATAVSTGQVLAVNAEVSHNTTLTQISDNAVLLTWLSNTGNLMGTIISTSGNTVSVGPTNTISTEFSANGVGGHVIKKVSPTKLHMFFRGSGGLGQMRVLTVSGTTVTSSAAVANGTGYSATRYSLVSLSDTSAILFHSGGNARAITYDANTGVASVGGARIFVASDADPIVAAPVSSTQAVVVYGTANTVRAQLITVSGGATASYSDMLISPVYSAYNAVASVGNGKVIATFTNGYTVETPVSVVRAITIQAAANTLYAGAIVISTYKSSESVAIGVPLAPDRATLLVCGISDGVTGARVIPLESVGLTTKIGTPVSVNTTASSYPAMNVMTGNKLAIAFKASTNFIQTAVVEPSVSL